MSGHLISCGSFGWHLHSQATCLPRPMRCSLNIVAPGFDSTLPDIHPGALPRLTTFRLYTDIISTLPVSWGSQPSVLPQLTQLDLGTRHFSGRD